MSEVMFVTKELYFYERDRFCGFGSQPTEFQIGMEIKLTVPLSSADKMLLSSTVWTLALAILPAGGVFVGADTAAN